MRLLNSFTYEMKEFVSQDEIPLYAILSHTWDGEEVSFHDWQTLNSAEVKQLKGFPKIEFCCRQAAGDGLEWVWIDTCCIDKSSSAELSESINSMSKWYKNAFVCYVFLSDVPDLKSETEIEEGLAKSRWYLRGWTLQELIAPEEVIFFSRNWQFLGTKSQLSSCLSFITKIDETYLQGMDLEQSSIAKRMSWAATRTTSRVEDMAYCLLGLFDVNMPLLYGEGPKAFQRLQAELMRAYPEDHTLFAWGTVVPKFSRHVDDLEQLHGKKPLDDVPDEEEPDFLFGLLAESPRDFMESGNFICDPHAFRYFHFSHGHMKTVGSPTLSGRAVNIELPLTRAINYARFRLRFPNTTQLRHYRVTVLTCGLQSAEGFKFARIPLIKSAGAQYARTREIVIESDSMSDHLSAEGFDDLRTDITVERTRTYLAQPGDVIFRRFVPQTSHKDWVHGFQGGLVADKLFADGFIQTFGRKSGVLCWVFIMYNSWEGLLLMIARTETDGKNFGRLHFRLAPVQLSKLGSPGQAAVQEPQFETFVDAINYYWYAWDDVPFVHEMATPYDTWCLDADNYANVRINSEVMFLDDDLDMPVDVVDLIITNRVAGSAADEGSRVTPQLPLAETNPLELPCSRSNKGGQASGNILRFQMMALVNPFAQKPPLVRPKSAPPPGDGADEVDDATASQTTRDLNDTTVLAAVVRAEQEMAFVPVLLPRPVMLAP